jgi:hypothetical protein
MKSKLYQISKILYFALTAIIALYSTIQQSQPALFWILKLVDEDGTFSTKIVFGLTWITLLIPLILIVILVEVVLKKKV